MKHSPINMLIVDDEPDIQPLFLQNFKREIQEGECRFHFAFSGEEAMSYLGSMAPLDLVLIISDINMPRMTGLELLKTVKHDFPNLKMMMFTAYNNQKYREIAMKMKADGFIAKPIDFDELKRAINSIVLTN
jgi:two-component system chemotaxis response regulator CheY